MFCRAMEIGLLGSRIAYALKEPYFIGLLFSEKNVVVVFFTKTK